jgi:hypothetical protein
LLRDFAGPSGPDRLEALGQFAGDTDRTIRAEHVNNRGKRGCSRFGDSKAIRVDGAWAKPANRLRRALSFAGKKPMKRKSSLGMPEAANAASVAEAPGIGMTRMPSSRAVATSR